MKRKKNVVGFQVGLRDTEGREKPLYLEGGDTVPEKWRLSLVLSAASRGVPHSWSGLFQALDSGESHPPSLSRDMGWAVLGSKSEPVKVSKGLVGRLLLSDTGQARAGVTRAHLQASVPGTMGVSTRLCRRPPLPGGAGLAAQAAARPSLPLRVPF